MFAACNGKGTLPGTKCRMNGFDLEGARSGPPNPQYVYVPHEETEAVLGHGARMGPGGPDVPVASGRKLRGAPIHHRGPGALERQRSAARLGMRRRAGRLRANAHAEAHLRQEAVAVLRLHDARRRTRYGRASVALLHESVQRVRHQRLLVGLSGRAAYLRGTRLEERRDRAADAVPHRRGGRQPGELHVDHADLHQLRPPHVRRRHRARRG